MVDEHWGLIKRIIDEAVEKRDQSVSLYFSPDGGMSITISPWPDVEEED